MTTLKEHFETESDECLRAVEALVDAADSGDARELYRLARMLRGGAQMAREDRVYRAAAALEAGARAVARGSLDWDEDVRERVRETVHDLRALIADSAAEHEQEARVADVLERWLSIGLALPERDVGQTQPGLGATESRRADDADEAFRTFASREIRAIAEVLAEGVDALQREPADREPLKAILRRQRALLGTARLEELSVIAETLRAVEDLSRVIARLGVGIKDEWLDVFRCARDVMQSASTALDTGRSPAPTNALSRLRTLHAEILERYGASESAPAETALARAMEGAQRTPVASDPPGAPAELDVQELMYDRDEAVRRIFELRTRIERAAGHDADGRAAVDELFDLLRVVLE